MSGASTKEIPHTVITAEKAILWLHTLPPDEPVFTLRAQDVFAPGLIETWAQLLRQKYNQEDSNIRGRQVLKVDAALDTAKAMKDWEPRKIPD